jgi:hypothetical protein
VEDFLYSKEGSEERLKVEKIIATQHEDKKLNKKKGRKIKDLSFNFYKELMEEDKCVDEKKCR